MFDVLWLEVECDVCGVVDVCVMFEMLYVWFDRMMVECEWVVGDYFSFVDCGVVLFLFYVDWMYWIDLVFVNVIVYC